MKMVRKTNLVLCDMCVMYLYVHVFFCIFVYVNISVLCSANKAAGDGKRIKMVRYTNSVISTSLHYFSAVPKRFKEKKAWAVYLLKNIYSICDTLNCLEREHIHAMYLTVKNSWWRVQIKCAVDIYWSVYKDREIDGGWRPDSTRLS